MHAHAHAPRTRLQVRVGIVTRKALKRGTELTYNYNFSAMETKQVRFVPACVGVRVPVHSHSLFCWFYTTSLGVGATNQNK